MFIDKVKKIAKNKRKDNKQFSKYRKIMKMKLLSTSLNGHISCCMWLPVWIDIDEFNEYILEDGVDCVFLYNNGNNTKQRVFVSEKINTDEFWKMVKRNMKYNKK